MATEQRTTKQVVDDTRTHLSDLVEAHIALAKAEVSQAQKDLAAAVVPFVVAGVLGLFILGFFGVTAAKALTLVWPEWLAWLTVSVALLLLALILALVGRSRANALNLSPEQTQHEIKDTVEWAKSNVKQVGS